MSVNNKTWERSVEKTKQSRMTDKDKLPRCCLVIKDHANVDFKQSGFKATSNAQELYEFQISYADFKNLSSMNATLIATLSELGIVQFP